MSKKLLNEKGFSLAEVMVAAGISGVVALGSMKIAENSQKGMRNMATKASMNNYVNFRLGSSLSETNACLNAFDTDGAGGAGDTITIAVDGGDQDVQMIDVGGATPLAEVGEVLPGSSGEFNVGAMKFIRNTPTSCSLQIDLVRNDSAAGGAKKLGGRDKREVLNLGCAFDNVTNDLTTCSTQGTASLGNWTYNNNGVEWLHNPTGTAVVGQYSPGSSVFPPARLVISKDDANTSDWNGKEDGIALPSNYVVRWGSVGDQNAGVSINGSADCISLKSGVSAEHLTSCQSTGTSLENSLTVNPDNRKVAYSKWPDNRKRKYHIHRKYPRQQYYWNNFPY